jgi:putative redox protein
MVALYARRKGWPLPGLHVDVVYDSDSDPRAFDVTLNLPAGLTESQVTRLERVAESCPVRRALQSEFTFRERTDTEPGPALAAA